MLFRRHVVGSTDRVRPDVRAFVCFCDSLLLDCRLRTSPVGAQTDSAMSRWEHAPHGADIGVVGIGLTKAEAFRQAAVALTAVVTDPRDVRPIEAIPIECHAADEELLLVEWLNAVIFEMAVRSMLFADYSVEINGNDLRATAWGERVDRARHQPAVEVKGATLTGLVVGPDPEGWRAQCIVDV